MSKETKQPQTKKSKKEEKAAEVPAKFADLVKTIEQMTVLELSELVKVLEDKFAVSAVPTAVGMAPTAAPATGKGEEPAAEEKSTFDVELTQASGNKIAAIKAVRAVSDLGLKDAKDLVESAPKIIKEAVPKQEAEEMKKKLEEAGVKVTLK